MKRYYIESIIGKIAEEIKKLAEEGVITADKKIVLYGLDTYSFAMRTILSNLGFQIDSYLSDEPELLLRFKRNLKSIRARYLKSSRDLIGICSLEERLQPFDSSVLIISSSKNCPKEKIENLNYQNEVNFFQIYDWEQADAQYSVMEKKSVTLKEIQSLQKEMLCCVDKFCMDRNIRYWVCGGTLLGTMRHKGFIPWDDDIDIFMPWEDYQRFIKEFVNDERYELMIPDKADRRDYIDLFCKLGDSRILVRENLDVIRKVRPLTLDIFPLIGLPEKKEKRLLFFQEYYEVEKRIWEDFYANNGDLDVYNKWYSKQKEFLEAYDFEQSAYVGVLGTVYRERDYTKRTVYDSTLRLPFEDIEVNVPAGYQEYLDNLYGKGWQELPDESRRVSNHNVEAYWL